MIVAGDFETHYSHEYSLSKMTTAEYVLDPRFETIMLSLKINDNPSTIHLGQRQIEQALAALDWSRVAWVSHHTNFDASILHWRFGHTPKLYLCTLSMARATTHWKIGRSSLAEVSKYLGLPPKGTEVVKAIGKRLCHFSREELVSYAMYCVRDNENCRAIFDRLRPFFNADELRLIDLIVRMHVEPQVKLNPTLLAEHLHIVQEEKRAIMEQVATIDPDIFSSQPRFAELLEQHGVDVPMKISPTTGKSIPALSKGDWAFKELCLDPSLSPTVQALLAARMSAKSTIEETRSKRLLSLSLKTWPSGETAWAPVPLKYYGVRTGRLSGDDLMNWQNLRRGSRLREAIEAPPGERIVHRDSSQIEARMTAWLANCQPLLEAFRQRRDVYSEFASEVYGVRVTKADEKRRFVGKTSILGLGYGAGHAKFRHMLYIGNGGVSVVVSEDEATQIVDTYRRKYREIRDLWYRGARILDEVIRLAGRFSNHSLLPRDLAGLPIELGHDSVWLPNGLCLNYPNIHWVRDPTGMGEIYYKSPYSDARVRHYGPKFIENLSQALSRIIITDTATRIYETTNYHPFLTTHDSLDYCVSEGDAAAWDAYLEKEFSVVPTWAPGLPLASEGGWGMNLLAAEKAVNE